MAFAFVWLSVMLMILAAWVAMTQAGRLLRWLKVDGEVLQSEVYSRVQGSGGRRSTVWGAKVTVRYLISGQPMVTTVDRGFQSAVRAWMEQWTRQYPAGSHRKILINPVDPLDADLHGEWILASFSSPVEFAMVAVLLVWGWRRLRRALPGS